MSKKLLTNSQAADYLGLNPQTLHNWRFNGKYLDYVKLGSRVLYDEAELDRFIEDSRVQVKS